MGESSYNQGTNTMLADGIKVPEDFVLIRKEDYNELYKLIKQFEQQVNLLKSNSPTELTKMVEEQINRSQYQSMSSETAVLVQKFDKMCKSSLMRSNLDSEKSKILARLKKELPALQKKQKSSQDALLKRFENGKKEIEETYRTKLLKGFENSSALNNSLPVEQFTCDELVNNYRLCVQTQIVPELRNMYREHCNTIDGCLKAYISNYTNHLSRVLDSHNRTSPAVNHKLNNILANLQCDATSNNHSQLQTQLTATATGIDTKLREFKVSQVRTPPSCEEEVEKFVASGDYHAALNVALSANNLDLVVQTCKQVPVDEMFATIPDQLTVLSLVAQLRVNLTEELELKAMYIQEAVQALDPGDPRIREHGGNQLDILLESILATKNEISPTDYARYLHNITWSTNMQKRLLSQR